MSGIRYGAIEPETMDDIRLGRMTNGRCDCRTQPRGGFFLCDYHEGFDDAIDHMKQTFNTPKIPDVDTGADGNNNQAESEST